MSLDEKDFILLVKEHMEIQPYSIHCEGCGKPLEIAEKKIDNELDIFVVVYPCDNCQTKKE